MSGAILRPAGRKGAPLDRDRQHLDQRSLGGRCVRRRDLLGAGDAAHLPAQLRHAHALRGDSAEGAEEPDGPQESEVDGGPHKGVCAGLGGTLPGAVFNAG